MNEPKPTIMYGTKCKICGHVFQSDPFLPRIGDSLDERRVNMGKVLLNHVAMQHLHFMQAILIAAVYQFEDPVIKEEMEGYRWQVHQNTSKNHATDAELEEKLTSIGFDAEQIQVVIGLRDLFTETGEHAVIKAKPLVQS